MATRQTSDLVRFFEELDVPEGLQAELIDGEIIVAPSGTPLHWLLIWALIKQFDGDDRWQCVAEQTLAHPRHQDRPEPDFLLYPAPIPRSAYQAPLSAEQVPFVAEILSRRNADNDVIKKPRLYARFGIPLYLVVDPFTGKCTLHLSPGGSGYREQRTTAFGDPIDLPDPVALTLDTTAFDTYAGPA
ncbi:Uma2 family endonuclease [Actinocorallia sp. API 0066]|uniref:Uma2 family endonuclease n=1 Tax=Actinocorallia sp. API 0066 TaxID=2896846 RepID=UPI001E3A3C9E|nr:Uma2 family endonuclease [Actinocorallia sp. API 0066]MCD0448996.1 Uma2 family endonuclease [Actinocorallia sp. API 0066]